MAVQLLEEEDKIEQLLLHSMYLEHWVLNGVLAAGLSQVVVIGRKGC